MSYTAVYFALLKNYSGSRKGKRETAGPTLLQWLEQPTTSSSIAEAEGSRNCCVQNVHGKKDKISRRVEESRLNFCLKADLFSA